jgi:hypothetical protein
MTSKNPNLSIGLALLFVISFGSCLTTKKFDAYVSAQYNDQLPQVNTKKNSGNILVSSALSQGSTTISTTEPSTKVLPLIVYWNIDHRYVCSLNSQIAVVNFSKAVKAMANKGLNEHLKGRKLELTVDQAPSTFSMVDKTNVVWVIYAVHWSKVYIQPDAKDLVVSYKLHQPDSTIKTGSITVKSKQHTQNLRLFQSWKSATSEYLSAYESDVTAMTKEFVTKLLEDM